MAASILPDYDLATELWNDRAGGWDYDNQDAGAALYSLDAVNVHSTTATTDKEFITNFVIGADDGTTVPFSRTLPVPQPPNPLLPGDFSYAIQPGTHVKRRSATPPRSPRRAKPAKPRD